MANNKGSSTWALLLVVAIIAAAMLWALWPKDSDFEQATGLNESESWQEIKARIHAEADKVKKEAVTGYEAQQIKVWITQNGLNEYGDPADTVYAGGTPLFDESIGETIDKYQYILEQHPDRPWKK